MNKFNDTLQNFGDMFSKTWTENIEKSRIMLNSNDSKNTSFELEERY